VSSCKKRQLTKVEVRALGATPGLMAHCVGPDGRAGLEHLAPEGPEKRFYPQTHQRHES
jgi:hypothetical protein